MANTSLSNTSEKMIDTELRRIWSLGANVIVAWKAIPFGIIVIYLPSYDLPRVAKLHDDLLDANRHIDSSERLSSLLEAGCLSKEIKMDERVGSDENSINAVNRLIRAYTVAHVPCRAVCLFDMVSFSLYSPFEQITQISVLSHYINLASWRCQRANMPVDICTTTTGDGFYMWNRQEGLMADIALYVTAMLALAYTCMARGHAKTEAVPRLRCALHWGSHYEYRAGSTGAQDNVFIVGDVTIDLARIISAAQAGQLLIGAYMRDIGDTEPSIVQQYGIYNLDTPAFMALAQSHVQKLVGIPIPSGKIEAISAFLSGRRGPDGTFSIRKYYVKDKHGLEHGCYNARLNLTSSTGEAIWFGLLDRDLGRFDARTDPNEDIIIRVD